MTYSYANFGGWTDMDVTPGLVGWLEFSIPFAEQSSYACSN